MKRKFDYEKQRFFFHEKEILVYGSSTKRRKFYNGKILRNNNKY